MSADTPTLTRKDFASDQTVRWCPGCGDYAILNAIQNALPRLGKKKEDIAFISGIGCAARFPYYMNTYGFHTIHGRAPAIASGTKLSNPNLDVWIITGDGDSLAIGGNHFIHLIRRNLDVNIILFNNQIYGLTKGQYSPTSKQGQVTKSTPFGALERPFSAGEVAIGAQATFFARTIDTNPKLMADIFVESSMHKGTSLVEVLQNCVIFNDQAHGMITDKSSASDNQLHLEQGKPMLFGENLEKGIRLNGMKLEVVTIGENGFTEADILVHDAHEPDPAIHLRLINMAPPAFPMALGIIRSVAVPTYEELVQQQYEISLKNSKIGNMDDLLFSGQTWKNES
jgi:2-oxoglutarate ferredoxin oxidoreductase subunit beta